MNKEFILELQRKANDLSLSLDAFIRSLAADARAGRPYWSPENKEALDDLEITLKALATKINGTIE